MKNIIEELWMGNICPMEKNGVYNSEYKQKLLVLDELEQAIRKNMTNEERERLEKYTELIYEMNSLLLSDAFKQGYKLSAKLTLEALT